MRYLLPLFLLFTTAVFSQKKILDHTVYNDWKRVADVKISSDGKYSVYTVKPHRGDGYLYIINNESGRKDSIFRAVAPVFAGDNSFVAFKITPGFDTLRKSELNKVKKDKWPKDSLGVFLFADNAIKKIEKVKSFYVSPESNWLVYLQDGNKLPAVKEKKRFIFFKPKKKNVKEYESEGNIMVMYIPSAKPVVETKKKKKEVAAKPDKTKDVKSIYLPEKGDYFAYTLHKKEKADSLEIRINKGAQKAWSIPQKFNAIGDISFNDAGTEIVFTASMDTSETKSYQLFHADLVNNKFKVLLDTVNKAAFPAYYRVSSNYSPYFSKNGNRIFFGIAEKPKPDPKDTLLESEKAKLDVWHWKDDRLQPQQLVERDEDGKKTLLSMYDLQTEVYKVLSSDTLEVRPQDHGNGDFAVAFSNRQYENAYNWEYPNKRDVYRLNLNTGELKLLAKAQAYEANLSPSGKYFARFNPEKLEIEMDYVGQDMSVKTTCVTCLSKEEWLEDINGMPVVPGPVGMMGWTRDEKLILQSKYDVWQFDPVSQSLESLTKVGSKQKIRFSLHEWNTDSTFIHFDNTYITGFHEKDKSMSLYKTAVKDGKLEITAQAHSDHYLTGFKKAKKADQYLFQRSSVSEYPDVHLASWKISDSSRQISFANPQQSEYNWATVELLSWKSYDGIPLEGLLYKPENYDSTKKYPLLVYFYEMYSDELHSHYAPKPTASIIFPTEYASAGYMVLIPDIRYKPGYPARGAYDCIMSGTDYVLRKYKSVDSTRMGLQGQSWGGYQTAQLVTMTKRYKAAMAGAPVGNMFSAYGGIRWGSGLNRQFQYERTQSRIGKTIWEAPELYVENSPLFHLPKVETPLLIMSNDADGAVPWYQGIELFTGLKRLNKPAWLLNYNGDDHNLMKNANRIDLSIRMRQFFDHYLLNAPAPEWLSKGVPAVDKGKKYGLELPKP